MKKFRGKKRYFRNLKREEKLDAYELDFTEGSWFDFWHTHLDWYGYGNLSLKIRKEHIKSQLILFNNLNEKLKEWGQPYQIWIELSHKDSSRDAVYVHTINPNEDNFPCKIPELNYEIKELPSFLLGIMDLNKFTVSSYDFHDQFHDEFDDELDDESDTKFIIEFSNQLNGF